MSSRFLAIDFETANYQRDSACAMGLVLVENGKIIEKKYSLIQPPSRKFVFTYIHGITWKHVEKAPLFSDLWPEIEVFFEDLDFIAAHNASFDQGVLRACCGRYSIPEPAVPYTCTVQLARKHFGIYPTNLPSVCSALRIPLKHHDAISDAIACAQIVIASHTYGTA